ncbi:MAG: glycosyltransferase family 4 protein [Bacteroidia bacterium]
MTEKLVYVVSEPACLIPGTGAFRHIEAGREMLSRHFSVTFLPLCATPEIVQNSGATPSEALQVSALKQSFVWGTLKDIYILFRHHRNFIYWYKKLKSEKPEVIYERAAYLNFNALIAARLLKIRHIYEANGIQYLVAQTQYQSLLRPVMKLLEKWAYKKSDYTFFVGSWGDVLKMKKKNWENIENGIEASFADQFAAVNRHAGDIIHVCFIGTLMPHHRMDVLTAALAKVQHKNRIHLHLVGKKFDSVVKEFAEKFAITTHGFLDRDQLAELLKTMDIGVIPGGFEYPSFMKLFEYGAAKLLVLAPRLYNLRQWFDESEILYFDTDNAQDLAKKIDNVVENPEKVNTYGEALYASIREKHTWEKIFEHKTQIIQSLRK